MSRNKNNKNPASHEVEKYDQSDVRFRTMFNTALVGIGILGLDRKLVDTNPSLFQMFGYTRDEPIGKNPL